MTRRQLFKNVGLGLAGLLALPLFGKPGKVSEPGLPMTDHFGNPWPAGVRMEPIKTFGSPSDVWGNLKNEELSRQIAVILAESPLPTPRPIIAKF